MSVLRLLLFLWPQACLMADKEWLNHDPGSGLADTDLAHPTQETTDTEPSEPDQDHDGTPDDEDCSPNDSTTHPGADEIVGNAKDEDCDGVEQCYADADMDGYRTDLTTAGGTIDCSGLGEALLSAPAFDCDDADPSTHPNIPERPGEGGDNNCDGVESCYVDLDGDGARSASVVLGADLDCFDPGEVSLGAPEDCFDEDDSVYPGAPELCDLTDQDCDTVEVGCTCADGSRVFLETPVGCWVTGGTRECGPLLRLWLDPIGGSAELASCYTDWQSLSLAALDADSGTFSLTTACGGPDADLMAWWNSPSLNLVSGTVTWTAEDGESIVDELNFYGARISSIWPETVHCVGERQATITATRLERVRR